VLVAIVSLVSIAGVACSLLTSVEGLSDGAVADGGAGQGSDGEAGAAETSTPGDGGDASSWCTTHKGDASFCEDFDTQGLTRWDDVGQSGGATATNDTTNPSSAPFALLSEVPALSGGGSSEAYVARRFPSAAKDLWVEAEFRLEKASTATQTLDLLVLVQRSPLEPDKQAWEVGFRLNGTTRKLEFFQYNFFNGAFSTFFTFPPPFPVDTWTRIGVRLEVTSNLSGNVDIDINGTRVATAVVVQPIFAMAPFQLIIGAAYVKSPQTGWTVRTDNVLFDAGGGSRP